MRYILLLVTSLIILAGCKESKKANKPTTQKTTETSAHLEITAKADEELKLYGLIRNNYNNGDFLDLQPRAEGFYKEYRMSDKMDSVELMYERALDVLDSIEMEEEGSLAFKRYRLSENPVLNQTRQ